MPSLRCSTCSINYPTHIKECPVCQAPTWLVAGEDPDEWWDWRAEDIRQKQEAMDDPEQEFTQPYWVAVEIHEFVKDAAFAAKVLDVYSASARQLLLKEGDVIETPGPGFDNRLFEVLGTIRPATGATYYYLRKLEVEDTIPQSWVAEFSGD